MISYLNKYDQFREICRIFFHLIDKDRKFLWLAIIYGIGISFLTLAVPVAVQLLINTVSYTASQEAVTILAILLFFCLFCSGVLTSIQSYIMELFERRIYARLSAEITLHTLYADYKYSERSNKPDYVNRYFDIMTVQKLVPSLIIGMFALALQTIVGIILVSSYHPFLMIFNMVFIFLLWLIWRVWGYNAMISAIQVSEAKYDTARHIENVAHAPGFYSAESSSSYAVKKSNSLIAHYLAFRRTHFRQSFMQQILLLILYALASSGLLGIGGILVIREELTLGQLVAAELILSSVFLGISKSGYLLSQIYRLGAAVEEIYRVYQMPIESPSGKIKPTEKIMDVVFDNARLVDDEGRFVTLDLTINAGSKIIARSSCHDVQQVFIQGLVGYIPVKSGRILVGQYDLKDIDVRYLRDRVIVLDRPHMVECTIKEYLQMRNENLSTSELYDMIELFELTDAIEELNEGLDTKMNFSGMPLTPDQVLRLKLASAILSKPTVIVLNEFYDTIPDALFERIFTKLKNIDHITMIYFTQRSSLTIFDKEFFIKNTHDD